LPQAAAADSAPRDQTFAKGRRFDARTFHAVGATRGAFELKEIPILLALLGVAFAAGYYTRAHISRRRREHARVWKNYVELEPPQAANTNQAPVEMAHGDLGQMLNRWEDRARLRRSQR
jgi:hypothetical protein